MGKLLEELRQDLINIHGQLRDAEDELVVLADRAADAIKDVESQKSKIEALREEVDRLEDAIFHLSS